MRAPSAAISNLGERASHAKESVLPPTQTRVLRVSSSNCGAVATLSGFLKHVALSGGLLGRIPTHSNEFGGRVMTVSSLLSSQQTAAIEDHFVAVDLEQPIALSDSEELIAKLDNEALLAKFLDVNANFIAVGPLARQFQEPRYFQLRDELLRIDLEIHRRALLGTPQHKAAVKAAHDQAWQVHIARPRAANSPVPGSRTVDRESAGPVAPQDTPPASTSAAAPASQMGDWDSADPVAQRDTPPASTSTVPSRTILAAWRDAIFALGHRWAGAQ